MSLSSMVSFGMLPNDEDFSELTGLGEWEEQWEQRNQAMENKKLARRQRGLGSVFNEQGLQPAFQMMERPIQAQMHAGAQVAQQAGKDQEQVAVEDVDNQGRRTVQYQTKEDVEQSSLANDGLRQEAAERAAAYASALKPKFNESAPSIDSEEAAMTR